MPIFDRNRVGTPRFYVDRGKYLSIKGYSHKDYFDYDINKDAKDLYALNSGHIQKLTDLNPQTPIIIPCVNQNTQIKFMVWFGHMPQHSINLTNINYIGLLGHNLYSAEASIKFDFVAAGSIIDENLDWNDNAVSEVNYQPGMMVTSESILEWGSINASWNRPKDGTFMIDISPTFNDVSQYQIVNPNTGELYSGTFSEGLPSMRHGMMVTIAPLPDGNSNTDGEWDGNTTNTFAKNINLGALTYGTFIDMPHAPDLDMVQTRVFDGVDTQRTLGGATTTNTLFTGSPNWVIDAENRVTRQQFSCSQNYRYETSEGRRKWDIAFSTMFDYEIFSPNEDYSLSGQSNDLYTVFVSKTLGGQLPFIFEYNTSTYTAQEAEAFDVVHNNTLIDYEGFADHIRINDHMPHHFAICRLEDSNFEYARIAPNLYDIEMSIIETW